jgi:hypothetical protein
MAKVPRKHLKVFQAQLGFYDTVVAAPSQAAALRAWGIHQNLFADGQARATEDARAVEAALAHPETPLIRAVGSKDAFAVQAASLPVVPDAPKSRKAKPAAKAKLAAPARPPADRAALDAAEKALRKLDEARKREEGDLRSRQEELDQEARAAQAAYVKRRKAATGKIVEARQVYCKAGGAD